MHFKNFTEEWLQNKIHFLNYGLYDKNLPSQVQIHKENLNQNASQLMCLFRNIGFILYDFQDNEIIKNIWICVQSLQKVVKDSSVIYESDIQVLSDQITTHLKSILDILLVQLLPKHHLLLHYPGIIREMGPIIHMSMMRYEAKHKALKTTAKRGNNYINITKTISMRHQAELVYKGYTYSNEIDCGKISRRDILDFNAQEREIVEKILEKEEMLCEIQWYQINNFTFRKHLAILHDKQFHEIDRILIVNDKYFFLCINLEFLEFE